MRRSCRPGPPRPRPTLIRRQRDDGSQSGQPPSLPWVSSANTDFNVDFGGSHAPEQVRSWGLDESALPPIVAVNAAATGTDVAEYLSESPAVSVFTRRDGAVYQTYATAGRGVEFLMGYYPILDRVPNGRDEGDAFQTWIRRHDEYV